MAERATRRRIEAAFIALMDEMGAEYNRTHLYSFKEVGGRKVGFCLDYWRHGGWSIMYAAEYNGRVETNHLPRDGMNAGRLPATQFLAALEFATLLERRRKEVFRL